MCIKTGTLVELASMAEFLLMNAYHWMPEVELSSEKYIVRLSRQCMHAFVSP